MKYSLVTLLSFAAAVSASPIASEAEQLSSRTIDLGLGHYSNGPFHFTSTYSVTATPGQVVGTDNKPTGGLVGAKGLFQYGINSHENIICYNITLRGFKGDYESKAFTSTHIHEGAKGVSGPPRIVFNNPKQLSPDLRNSVGCVRGPFKTGIVTDGKDSGDGFHVKQIEKNPCGFFTDVHSSLAVPGAVRGQLS